MSKKLKPVYFVERTAVPSACDYQSCYLYEHSNGFHVYYVLKHSSVIDPEQLEAMALDYISRNSCNAFLMCLSPNRIMYCNDDVNLWD